VVLGLLRFKSLLAVDAESSGKLGVRLYAANIAAKGEWPAKQE
jgi:hypothetical protein